MAASAPIIRITTTTSTRVKPPTRLPTRDERGLGPAVECRGVVLEHADCVIIGSGPIGHSSRSGETRRHSTLTHVDVAKPNPKAVDPEQLVELAQTVLANDRFPQLATIDGDQPRLRPVSPVKTDGFTVYVANLRSYHKTLEIQANPKVELCYVDEAHNQVRITGVAEVVSEPHVRQEIWDSNPLLRQYLGTIDNPELIVYRVRPHRVRYMREWALEYYDVP